MRAVLISMANVVVLGLLLPSCFAWTSMPMPTVCASAGRRHHEQKKTVCLPCGMTLQNDIPNQSNYDAENDDDDEFWQVFCELGFDNNNNNPGDSEDESLPSLLARQGLWDHHGDPSRLLQTICRDYYTIQQPNQLTRMLQDDFHLPALQAHMVRTVLWKIYEKQQLQQQQDVVASQQYQDVPNQQRHNIQQSPVVTPISVRGAVASEQTPAPALQSNITSSLTTPAESAKDVARPLYKQVKVRTVSTNRTVYGLSSISVDCNNNDNNQTALLRIEMHQFWHEFMTRPNPHHPTAAPLRNATAEVYVRHANLFLGWYLQHYKDGDESQVSPSTAPLSLCTIFVDDSVDSVSILLDFVRWLREDRDISASYEANVWRGLTKLVQFRHTQLEGQPAAVLEDLPALKQIRKWHREASNSAKKAPRRSQEDRKWLSWDEYLGVVQQCKQEFLALEQEYRSNLDNAKKQESVTPQERRIATALQRYLVLAIFATVPDRQRTIRELRIDQSLVKDAQTGMWCIKHAPQDYKTGKTYGERPKLLLHGLTDDIDLFLNHWRPKLQPLTDFLFVQSRTRKPLTQDSVYQMVSRACYQFTGQRTNPHLLRDSIVTHVRESTTTSEAELEALAMLMGHSVAVQRASYDRRTLAQKVAPAVDLMQKVNGFLQ